MAFQGQTRIGPSERASDLSGSGGAIMATPKPPCGFSTASPTTVARIFDKKHRMDERFFGDT
jgi:hypothetical protein